VGLVGAVAFFIATLLTWAASVGLGT